MSVPVDTNILVYAANQECSEHAAAERTLANLSHGERPWFLTWGVIYEFLRVATHLSISRNPFTAEEAVTFVARLLDSPELRVLKETEVHLSMLWEVVRETPERRGNTFHDVHIVSLMREHGIATILTADKGFQRFKDIGVTDPVHGV